MNLVGYGDVNGDRPADGVVLSLPRERPGRSSTILENLIAQLHAVATFV